MSESEPGPPFSQRVSGASLGFSRASKNQKNLHRLANIPSANEQADILHIGLFIEADVSGIVIDTFGGLADALLAGLLVPDLCALRRGDGRDTCSIDRYLAFNE